MRTQTYPKEQVAINPATFFVPATRARRAVLYERLKVVAILPTYKPTDITRKLVCDLLKWNPELRIVVVDDSTPESAHESIQVLTRLATLHTRVRLLRTSENKLKAGALNYALRAILAEEDMPDAIITLDDDVIIEEDTVERLVVELLADPARGAVCSQCRVYNKNANLLTRLQGLEYLGFNAIRLADHGFLRGPLVMHGMLTAFKTEAVREAGGFAEGHLIEDYEITSRLKSDGWSVASAPEARAYTVVPETLGALWRQRTRWSYGGLTVVFGARKASAVFQDILGHSVFLSMIVMLFALSFTKGGGAIPRGIMYAVIALSVGQLLIWYSFQLWQMSGYRERDAWDWTLRAALIPEFLYSYLLTAALVGSYIFFLFNVLSRRAQSFSVPKVLFKPGEALFRILGYTEKRWGTHL